MKRLKYDSAFAVLEFADQSLHFEQGQNNFIFFFFSSSFFLLITLSRACFQPWLQLSSSSSVGTALFAQSLGHSVHYKKDIQINILNIYCCEEYMIDIKVWVFNSFNNLLSTTVCMIIMVSN